MQIGFNFKWLKYGLTSGLDFLYVRGLFTINLLDNYYS